MGVKQRMTDDAEPSGQIQQNVDTKVVINVGGVRQETWLSTLEMYPGTRLALLASLKETDESYDQTSKEYFFDRHPKAFENILQYYRTEELHVDHSVCGNLMKKELTFWGIEESEIEPCCWGTYSRHTEHKKTLEELDDNFAYVDNFEAWEESMSKLKKFQLKVWNFLEVPNSSRGAKIFAVVSMFFVALSISIFVLETHKMFQIDAISKRSMMEVEPDEPWAPTGSPLTCCCEPDYNVTSATPVTHPVLQYLDYICVGFFTLELLVRFAFCPNKCKFFRDIMNIIDIICLVPYLTSTIIRSISLTSSAASVLKTVLMIRIVRILRIFKLMKHYSAFKILVYTLKVSTKELFLMVVFLMTGVLMFASLVHYVERTNFPNIPIGIWWALVTMTTVGYGDKYTVSIPGYAIGSICVISGVLVIAFTVPIVVNNFSLYYSHAQTRIKAPMKRKKKEKNTRLGNFIKRKGFLEKLKEQQKAQNPDGSFDSLPTSSRETSGLTTDDDQKELVKVNNTKVRNRKKDKVKTHSNVKGIEDVDDKDSDPKRKSNQIKKNTDVAVEDIESFDSGFDDCQTAALASKKYEAESKKIMDDVITNAQKQEDERKRQEWLIKRKRQIRARLKEATTPRDIHLQDAAGKTGDRKMYKAKSEDEDETEA